MATQIFSGFTNKVYKFAILFGLWPLFVLYWFLAYKEYWSIEFANSETIGLIME